MALDPGMLRTVTPFAGLTPATLTEIAAASFLRRYRKGMLVFAAGEPSEAVFFIVSGRVRVFRTAPDGHEQVLQVMPAGQLLAIVGFAEGHPYPASAETLEECVIGVIRNAEFARLVRSRSDLAWALVVYMGQRLLLAQERIYDFALRSAGGRLAAALLRIVRQTGTRAADGRYALAGLPPHRELAQLAGISRETATRLLQAMHRDGAVSAAPDGRLVLDPRRLAAWIDPEGRASRP